MGVTSKFEVSIVAKLQAGDDGFADERGVKGTEVGAEDFGIVEGLVKALALAGAAAPSFEGGVGPGNVQVRQHDGDAFAEHLENEVILKLQGRFALVGGKHRHWRIFGQEYLASMGPLDRPAVL